MLHWKIVNCLSAKAAWLRSTKVMPMPVVPIVVPNMQRWCVISMVTACISTPIRLASIAVTVLVCLMVQATCPVLSYMSFSLVSNTWKQQTDWLMKKKPATSVVIRFATCRDPTLRWQMISKTVFQAWLLNSVISTPMASSKKMVLSLLPMEMEVASVTLIPNIRSATVCVEMVVVITHILGL